VYSMEITLSCCSLGSLVEITCSFQHGFNHPKLGSSSSSLPYLKPVLKRHSFPRKKWYNFPKHGSFSLA
jgi:hypothetical protein